MQKVSKASIRRFNPVAFGISKRTQLCPHLSEPLKTWAHLAQLQNQDNALFQNKIGRSSCCSSLNGFQSCAKSVSPLAIWFSSISTHPLLRILSGLENKERRKKNAAGFQITSTTCEELAKLLLSPFIVSVAKAGRAYSSLEWMVSLISIFTVALLPTFWLKIGGKVLGNVVF